MKVGDKITVRGKSYEITGTHKRSFLLKDAQGRTYKATEEKLSRMMNARKPAVRQASSEVPLYLQQKVSFAQIFDKSAKLPETEVEIMAMFSSLGNELSPENLHCDGEISASAARRKRDEIMKAWRYLEAKLGRNVSTDDYV